MSYTFAEAICDHLAERDRYRLGYRRSDLLPDAITDVDVRWDSGESHDPTYDRPNSPPSFEISVSFRMENASTLTKQVEPGWAVENLMRLALGLEVNP